MISFRSRTSATFPVARSGTRTPAVWGSTWRTTRGRSRTRPRLWWARFWKFWEREKKTKLKLFLVRAADNFNCSGSPSQRVRGLPAIRGEYSLSENFLVFSFLESKKLFSKYFSQGGFILGRGCRDEARWPALPLLGLDGWRCRLFQQSHHICQYHRQHHPYQCPHTHGHVHRWSGGLLALPRLHDQPTPVQESSRGAGVPQRWQFRLWSSILRQLGSIGGKL